jgi:hypothetical protein
MELRFVGGPYDGREIEAELLGTHASIQSVESGSRVRQFVLMPSPDDWARQLRGEATDPSPAHLYERVAAPDGPRLVYGTPDALDQARFESSVTLRPRARTALSTLEPETREAAVRTVVGLLDTPPDDWPGQVVKRDQGGWALRMVPIPGGFWAFILPQPVGRAELLDILRDDTLRLFLAQYQTAGAGRAG